jgi:asparagine synthase (glutamine-hydrolysing)
MCGIAGFTRPAPGAHRILVEMGAALGHRGPDGSGAFVDDRIALGHTRLAIVDIAGGAQPRVDEASGDALALTGGSMVIARSPPNSQDVACRCATAPTPRCCSS